MPISGASSYVPTCQAFLSHWEDVDSVLGAATPLTIAGQVLGQSTPIFRAGFEALYNSLLAQRDAVTTTLVDLDLARGDAQDLRAKLVTRIGQFIGEVRGNLAGTKYERALPELPDSQSTQDTLQKATVRAVALWTKLNADLTTGMTLPLVLEGGFALGGLTDLMNAIPLTYLALEKARGQVKLEREERNDLQDRIYPVLKAYRQVMPQKFPAGHALITALPDLTPKPGATPDAVALTAVWSAADTKAKLEWAASSESALDHYEVRAVPGEEYDVDDEVQVASIPKNGPRLLLTEQFLSAPGQHASFKVYVVLTTGNEAGSEPVTVTRPG